MDQASKILSDVVAFRTYAKYLPNFSRRESFQETVNRTMNHHLDKFPTLSRDIVKAFEKVHSYEIMPAMRGLQFSGDAISKNSLRQYNCSYTPVDNIRVFGEILFLLLSGSGCGFSVQQQHIKDLPFVKQPKEEGLYVCHDSIEGWAQSLDQLIEAYFYKRIRPLFDFSFIRPKGAYLSTTGAKAPGPEPLKHMLLKVEEKLKVAIGRQLKAIEVHDLICIISDAVIAGGVRRSSLISLFDRTDEEMLKCKSGEWWNTAPWRARANNSVVLPRGEVSKEEFDSIFAVTAASGAGEPGFTWTNDARNFGVNPCITGDTLVYVADGRGNIPIKQLAEEGEDVPVFCYTEDKKVSIRTMRNPRLTGIKVPVYKVLFDDASSIRVTANHKLLLAEGYKEVKDLVVGDSVLTISRYEASIKDIFPKANSRSQDYFWINNGQRSTKAEHRYIAEFFSNTVIKNGEVVHHIDYNARNNSAANLVIMSRADHDNLHRVDKLGDKNPMRRAQKEWSTEKWQKYKTDIQNRTKGAVNTNANVVTQEELKNHALMLTNKLSRRFSVDDWIEYAKVQGLPQHFSAWRKAHLNTIAGLAKWAALECGYDLILVNLDPRTVRYYSAMLEKGYDVSIKEAQVWFNKNCEFCESPFSTLKREIGFCSQVCSTKRNWDNVETKQSMQKGMINHFSKEKEAVKIKQIKVFNDLKFKLKRGPAKKEWVQECEEQQVSFEIARKSSPFRYWKDLVVAAESYNHRVVSVELYGYEDVYNGTVDEYHNFFIGAFAGVTKAGKPKWTYFNNLQCGEVSLENNNLCNLTTINQTSVSSKKDFLSRIHSATLLGTLQASYTDFPYVRDRWRRVCEAKALLGVSFTGIGDREGTAAIPIDWLEEGAKYALEVNEKYARKIGINLAARLGTVKPEGSASIVCATSSGIHARHAPYYLRRVRMSSNDSLAMYLKYKVPELMEEDKFSPHTVILTVPQKAPASSVYREQETALTAFNRAIKYNKYWIQNTHREGSNYNNVSVTISVKDNEWDSLCTAMWDQRDNYTGISLLPYNGGTYIQAPFEECNEETYNTYFSSITEINLKEVKEDLDLTDRMAIQACGGGACEIT